jgi:hypothetical protein
MLTEETGYTIDTLPDGSMKVRVIAYIIEDGVQVSQSSRGYYSFAPEDTTIPGQIAAAILALPEYVVAAAREQDKMKLKAVKELSIETNLPSWQIISDAIDQAATLPALKIIVKKMARVLYWIAKGTET